MPEDVEDRDRGNATTGGNGVAVVPPYMSFRTLLNLLERLEEHGLPNRIDRSVLANLSGGYAGQVLAGLESLGLIEKDGVPKPELVALVSRPDRRKTLMAELLRYRYPTVFAKDLTRMTPQEMDEAFRDMGLSGETRRKAITFFMHTASYAEIPLSPMLANRFKTGTSAPRRGTVRVSRTRRTPPKRTEEAMPVASSSGSSTRSIELSSGGMVTISVSVDPFALSIEDRTFVFDLVDKLINYSRVPDEPVEPIKASRRNATAVGPEGPTLREGLGEPPPGGNDIATAI